MSVEPRLCGSCTRVEGDRSCSHCWKYGDEIKTTNPPFRWRTCAYCPASEHVAVCITDVNRLYPCGRGECKQCPPALPGLAHSDEDGTAYCHVCTWSRKCDAQEEIEFHIDKHLREVHGVRPTYYSDDETGKRTEIPK